MATGSDAALRLTCIERALREYFSSNLSVQEAEDPTQFRTQMLLSSSGMSDDIDVTVDQVFTKVSEASYVRQLAVVLNSWHGSATNPLQSLSTATAEAIEGVTSEISSRQKVRGVSIDAISAFVGAVTNTEEDIYLATSLLVKNLGGARGILTLLGFQQTVGSRTLAPLTRRQCLETFAQRHSPMEPLTVGARAFSKHCARSSSGWWGELKGNDAAKNARAETKVCELLDTATWKNIHSLPHAHATMEIRNALGYGARWDAETHSFRGFLEPPMANGHEIGWRH